MLVAFRVPFTAGSLSAGFRADGYLESYYLHAVFRTGYRIEILP